MINSGSTVEPSRKYHHYLTNPMINGGKLITFADPRDIAVGR